MVMTLMKITTATTMMTMTTKTTMATPTPMTMTMKITTTTIISGILWYHRHNHHRYHYHYHRPEIIPEVFIFKQPFKKYKKGGEEFPTENLVGNLHKQFFLANITISL